MRFKIAVSLASCCAFTACSSFSAAPPSAATQTVPGTQRSNSSEPTLYILNREVPKAAGYVSAYADAGATYERRFGVIKNETFHGVNYANMTADTTGHLYLYPAKTRGQILVYEKHGADILQTIQYHKDVFSNLTLDKSGNLFGNPALFEFASAGHGSLEEKPLHKRDAVGFWIATDRLGDVGGSGGINGFDAFAPTSRYPFWTLKAPGVEYLDIAFGPSNNLYAIQSTSSTGLTLNVYAYKATTPSYTISDGAYAPIQLAFDGSGNLYVLNYCSSNCGTIKNSISIYAPGATTPTTVLQPPAGATFGNFAVSSAGYVAALENLTYNGGGPVVVYPPQGTTPSITISTGLQRPVQMKFGG